MQCGFPASQGWWKPDMMHAQKNTSEKLTEMQKVGLTGSLPIKRLGINSRLYEQSYRYE